MADPNYTVRTAEEQLRYLARGWWGTLPERFGVEFEVKYVFNAKDTPTLKRWLFYYEGQFTRHYQKARVFWLGGYVRVIGLSIGAGVFYKFFKQKVVPDEPAE